MSKKKYEHSGRQIRFWVPTELYELWERFRIEHGFTTMTQFLIRCVNDIVFPMPSHSTQDQLSTQLQQLEQIRQKMQEQLKELYNKQNEIIKKSSVFFKEKHASLEKQIILYLKKVKSANEFLISHDLNKNIEVVYTTLCDLKEKEKVKLNDEQEWELNV
ncbi:MAG: hypothetical protein ACTSXF_01360 [Promethearchaeota archaeon]